MAGGAERIIYEVGKRIANAGNELTILSGGWRNCKKKEYLDGIFIARYGHKIAPHLALPVVLFKMKQDLIISDLGHAVPWVFPILFKKKTIVSFLHLHAKSLPGQVNRILALIIAAIEKCYFVIYHQSKFVTISNTSFKDLLNLGINPKDIVLINPGVNRELFVPSAKTNFPSIVYFGGMRPYKRPEEALYLLSELVKRVGNLRLTVIGDGPSRSKLENLSQHLKVQENVTFTGRVNEEELSKLVSSSWLNIHCSVTEGWGISIIEASSAGTPTVAYEVAGVSDSIENGINGITVQEGDREALMNAALTILSDPKEWWASSVEVARKYSWDRTAKMWNRLIHEVAGQ